MSAFKLLSNKIQKLLVEKGLAEATESQALAIPEVLKGENILLIAPTGIGKTEAVILPLLHKILTEKPTPISLIYVTPLRALNRDLYSRLVFWCSNLGVSLAVRHSDTTQQERRRQVLKPPDVLITTPETLQLLLIGKKLRELLKNIRFIIIDEVHELATSERGAQLAVALERLEELVSKEFQRIGLSATIGTPDLVANFLVGKDRKIKILKAEVSKKLEIEVTTPIINDQIEEQADKLEFEPKLLATLAQSWDVIKKHNSTLLFVNTRDAAEFLVSRFRKWDAQPQLGIHHGSLSKEVRVKMENAFKAQTVKALVATSSLELGIDIGSADFVLQYNSPRQVSRLVQRVGRSGHRVGEISKGAVIATTAEEYAESFVLARRALNEELEATKIRASPLAVLANQIIAFGLTGKRSIESAYKTITRSCPFRNLSFVQFTNVLELLRKQKLLFIENGSFRTRKLGREYFYENISMIPDERVYYVIDLTTRESIGTLDESFVVSYLEEDKSFTMKGQPWRVRSVGGNRIFVTPCSEGEIPSWLGEEISVPFEVALEVGALRRTLQESEFPELKPFREYIKVHLEAHPLVPNDKLVTLEKGDNLVIVNACFGSKVNQTLARLISTLLASRIGSSVGVHSDAYRVILELPENVNNACQLVKEYLKTTKPEGLENFIKASLINSSLFKWYFLHVAKKFGSLKKEFDYKALSFRKIIDAFKGTIIWEEALAKVLFDKMDLDKTKLVLAKIQSGDIKLEITKLTPIGLEGYKRRKELILPERAEREILDLLKRRLERKRILVVCLSCKKARSLTSKNYLPKCHYCNSVLLGVADFELVEKLKKDTISRNALLKLKKSANLLLSYGARALLAFAARGVGVTTAARILEKPYFTEQDFLRELLRAEVTYARTRKFWD